MEGIPSPAQDAPDLKIAPRRRDFFDWLLGLSAVSTAAAIFYPVVRYLLPPAQPKGRSRGAVLVGKVSDLPPGSAKVFPLGTKPAILVHTPDQQWRAFSAKCTHLSCTVRYQEDTHLIWCPCHDGRFDLTGKNVSGPPPRPLPEFRVVIKGEEIYVTEAEAT